MNDFEKKKLAWHRHPIAVSSFSLLIGGLLLTGFQNCYNEKKTLLNKQYSIIEDVNRFYAESSTVFRAIDTAAKSIKNTGPNSPSAIKSQEKMQKALEVAYNTAQKLEFEIVIYFPNTRAEKYLLESKLSLRDKVNEAAKKIEEAVNSKSLSSLEKLFHTSDYTEQKRKISKILVILANEIGIDVKEGQPSQND